MGMNWLLAQTEPPKTSFWGIERTSDSLFAQPLFWYILVTLILTCLVLFAVSRVPSNFRKPISVAVTFLAGLFYVVEWLLPRSRTAAGDQVAYLGPINFGDVVPVVPSISQVLTGMLLALGVLSIFRVHFGRLFKMQKDWFFSAVLLVSLFAMTVFGIATFQGGLGVEKGQAAIDAALRSPTPPPFSAENQQLARTGIDATWIAAREAKKSPLLRLYQQSKLSQADYDSQLAAAYATVDAQRTAQEAALNAAIGGNQMTPEMAALVKTGMQTRQDRGVVSQGFALLFQQGLLAMDAAMFSLIGFFILSAAYRAFRIRSVEASILMATALIVLLMFVPIALRLTSGIDPGSFAGNFRIDSIGMWLLTTINVPAIRAIDLGLGFGLVAMALRIMLGLERGVAAD
jgi:hypothetical protein